MVSRNRVIDVSPVLERAAQIAPRRRICRVESHGLAVSRDRLIHTADCLQGGAEIVVALGIIGFQPHGFAIRGDRVIHASLFVKGVALFVMRDRLIHAARIHLESIAPKTGAHFSTHAMNWIFLDSIEWDYDVATPMERPLGGSQSALCYLASALARRGHAVATLTATKIPRVVNRLL